MLADCCDRVFIIIFHALTCDTIKQGPMVVYLITHDAIMAGSTILAGIVAILAFVFSVVLVGIVSAHILAQVRCEVEVVIAHRALPCFHVEDHSAHS